MPKYEFTVSALPQYVGEQSDPEADDYRFAYTMTIRNTGDVPAKLISRHWVITDSNGEVKEMRGPGVVGEQPVLKPGEAFQYTSGTQMPTPVGKMRGTYQCVAADGTAFEATIPEFILAMPRTLH